MPPALSRAGTPTRSTMTSGDIEALAVSGSTVYAGGDFSSIGGQARNDLAALDASSGLATTWDPEPARRAMPPSTLSPSRARPSTPAGSSPPSAARPAPTSPPSTPQAASPRPGTPALPATSPPSPSRARPSTPAATSPRSAARPARTSPPSMRAPAPPRPGTLTPNDAGRRPRRLGLDRLRRRLLHLDRRPEPQRIAALDATSGLATAWDPSAAAEVFALAVSGSTVYVGGEFDTIGGQSRNNLAAVDATSGLATAWTRTWADPRTPWSMRFPSRARPSSPAATTPLSAAGRSPAWRASHPPFLHRDQPCRRRELDAGLHSRHHLGCRQRRQREHRTVARQRLTGRPSSLRAIRN